MKTFLQSPYFDDYDENKKFYSALFRPSFPVQARELNSLNSMVQKQIERLGNHMFKDGAKVLDGQMSFDTSVSYVKLQRGFTTNIENLVGLTLTGKNSLARADVLAVSPAEGDDPATLFVKFIAGDGSSTNASWSNGEPIVEYSDLIVSGDENAIGTGSIATIQRGVYYVKSYFVLVDKQTIVLDKYSNVPSYRVGLTVKETIVTPEQDESLLDNAQGSYNYAAPGAHRYKIELILDKITLANKVDSTSFIELGQIQGGRIIKQVTKTEYSELEQTLARRTYDESGDYTVTPFKAIVREHRNNDRGQWKANTKYLVGDVVRNYGLTYIARNSGISENDNGPVHSVGKNNVANTEELIWERVSKPVFNNGVYPAEGKLTRIEILDGGKGYILPPEVDIQSESGKGAVCTAVISEGKVIDVIIDDPGAGYLESKITIKFTGGLATEYDADVSTEKSVAATAFAYTNAGDSEKLAVGFESGKAYVQGFEIEKIGTSWVTVDKARDKEQVNDVLLTPSVGNYLQITSIAGGIPQPGSIVDLYNITTEDFSTIGTIKDEAHKYKVGSCRVRGIEWDEGYRTDGNDKNDHYKLFVYDLEMQPAKNLYDDVKSLVVKNGTQGSTNTLVGFNANIATESTQLTGGVCYSKTNTITGSGTVFMDTLKSGDYIKIVDTNKVTYRVRVKAVVNNNELTLYSNGGMKVDPTNTYNAYYLETSNLYDPQGVSALYRLPHDCVDDANIGDIDYIVSEVMSSVVDNNEIKFTTTSADARFASFQDSDNYLLFDELGNTVDFVAPDSVEATRSITLKVDGYNGKTLTFFATLRKTGNGIGLGKKVLETGQAPFTTQTSVQSNILKLGQVDVYRIDSVTMYPSLACADNVDFTGAEGVDITDRYQFFDGQTESYYGESYLVLKSSYSAPQYPVIVNYTYFKRDVEGDYYSVQSYKDAVAYTDIPSFNGIRLSDVLDFRPDILESNANTVSRKSMLKRGTEIELSYRYYLGRKDRICLDYMGNFVDVRGISALAPRLAEMPALSMNVANIEVKPYTFTSTANDVVVEMVDNKRYTMRDIGRLENRINTLEQYTTLSLLETQTESLLIRDSEGYDRFKQGFVVDNFKTGLLLTTNDDNAHCSIDIENGVCRPPFVSRHVSLFEHLTNKTSIKDQRIKLNYRLYGKVYTLPLDPYQPHVAIVEQPLATRIENVNPFAIVAFVGSMTINPSSDDWFDTNYLPDVVNNVEGNYLSTKNELEGTKWNDWQISWTGAKVTTGSISQTQTSTKTGATIYWGWDHTGGHWRRDDTTTTTTTTITAYAQQQGQTRTGIKTTVTATTDYEVVGDRLVSTASIPYMRSRWLLIKAKNLKPYTTYIPKFDGVDVDYWCVPAATIQLTDVVGKFDCTSGAGSDTSSAARRIDTTKFSYWREETDRTCLDIGDVISDDKYTAVVVGVSKTPYLGDIVEYKNTIADTLYVVNIKNRDGTPVDGIEFDDGVELEGSGLTFNLGTTVSAARSISGAKGTVIYAEPNQNHAHAPLVSNSAGELNFMFWIPDGDKIEYGSSDNETPVFRFRCGDRILSLHEGTNNDNTSSAEAIYSAVGTIQNREKTVNAVRNAVVTTSNVTENRTVTNTGADVSVMTSTKTRQVNLDPLAQTFIIGDAVTGGCFLSKVDLYFATKPSTENPLPVTVQIRTVENGIPTGKVLPFASVTLRPDQVNISSKTIEYVDASGNVIHTNMYDTPTTFEFESPVYVEDTAEYAIVVISDSTDYNLWIAQIGEVVPGQNTLVSKQPHTGVMFKSQNASTWTPVQNQDLKFTLYRANFKVSDKDTNSQVIGRLAFACQPSQLEYLGKDPFQTKTGSSLVRVWHRNHGLCKNMKVKIVYRNINDVDNSVLLSGTINADPITNTVSGKDTRFVYEVNEGDTLYSESGALVGVVGKIYGNNELDLEENPAVALSSSRYTVDQVADSFNGILYENVYDKVYTIKEADLNSYVIDVGQQATSSGYGGGDSFMAAPVINYELIQPTITYQSFSDTMIQCGMQTVTGTGKGSLSQNELTVLGVVDNDNNVLVEPMAIYSEENRDIAKSPSLIFNVSFASNNSCLSPIIDSDRVGAILVSNIIDNPTHDVINYKDLDTLQLVSGKVFTMSGNVISASYSKNNTAYEVLLGAGIGKYISIHNVNRTLNGSTKLMELNDVVIQDIIDYGDRVDVVVDRNFDSIIENGKEVEVSYSTTDDSEITLHTSFVEEFAPLGGTVHSKYITKPISLSNTCNYLRIMFAGCVPKTSNIEVYYKTYQMGGNAQYEDVKWTLIKPEQPIAKVEVGSEVFTDINYIDEEVASFDVVAVKVVFKSDNTAAVPKIKDLRIIACA